MKRILLSIILLIPIVGMTQSIVVDDPMTAETNFTPEQMITEVLIGGSGCGDVDFTFLQENPDGTTDIDQRSWGYFDATGTSFPFGSGLILGSGFSKSAQGPNDMSAVSDGTWGGDADLATLLNNQNMDTVNTNDATVFQFTFVPVISELSFNFLFASEEYGNQNPLFGGENEQDQECGNTFRDGFAFLLRGPGIPDDSGTAFGGTNIAAVPGSTTPVSTGSIHNDGFLCGQEVLGVNFFPELYVNNVQSTNLNEIQFDGHTLPLVASASLIPGETYELKMVIADRGDSSFDSAVFFEAGSFNIGVALPPDATIVSGNAPCDAEEFTFGVEESAPGATFQWSILNPTNGVFDILPDETDNEITVTQPGTYQIEAILSADCTATDEIIIEFAARPVAVIPDLIRECDEAPNDGITLFDLTQADAQIINGQTDVLVDYYESQMDAEMETNVIPDPTIYENTTPNFQIVWARLEDIFRNCFDIVPLEIQVDFAPEITVPISDFFLCDNDEDGLETFDLTTKDDEITNTLVDVGVMYFETLADAQAGTNPIPNPTTYTTGFTTIYVQATNILGCTTEGSFNLILGETPPFTAPFPLIGCDIQDNGTAIFDPNEKNDEITAGVTGLTVSYYGNILDAENAEDPLTIPYTSTGETIWVRIEDDITGCYSITTLLLEVAPLPTICQPDPLVFCDTDNDGIGIFDLNMATDQVRCGDPSGNLIVTYHESPGEADSNTNALISPYLNIVAFNQTVIARLTDIDTGCFDTVELELIVGNSPVLIDPEPLVLCDDDGDGIEIFDLTVVEPMMLPSGIFVVEYFESQANADSGTNPIEDDLEMAYPNQSNPQTIFIVVTDTENGCSSQTTVELQVNLQPALTPPAALILCDINNPGDQIEVFDLNSTISEITGGDTNIFISFYTSQADADAGINAIGNPQVYENTDPMGNAVNPQDIFISAEDSTTGCLQTMSVTLELRVENLPSPQIPEPLEVCDDNNDGFAFFDLTLKNDEIIGNETPILISYHETLLDAENGTNPIDITMLYPNIIQFMQTVYARVESDITNMGNGCYNTVPLNLVVIDSPIIPLTIEPLVACENDGDGFEVFDLTQQETVIYVGQDPDDFSIAYYESLAFAEAGFPEIANPTMYTNTVNPQEIWYRLDTDDADNFCNAIGSFFLQVVNGPVAPDPFQLEVCDTLGEPSDGIFTFDLTLNDQTITGGIPGLSVQYFLLDVDAQANVNPISPANEFTNTTNPQTIYARVTDSNTTCVDFTTIELIVVSNPDPPTNIALELCDDNNTGDEIEDFNLTLAAPLIIGGANWTVQYYTTFQDAFDMTNGIPDPTVYPNVINPDVVFIRVDNLDNLSGCFEIVEVQLIVNPLPDDSAIITDYLLCEIPSDNIAEFDLTIKDQEALGQDQDPALFEVSYYLTAQDAEDGVNVIANPDMFPATIDPAVPFLIFTGITNLETGCYIGGVQFFALETGEGATATAPTEPYTICDAEGDNDGITSFNLFSQNNQVNPELIEEILGGQSQTMFLLTFHETLELATDGLEPIPDIYTNIINPQVIFARVTNLISGCSDTAEVILNVVQLPLISLPETFRLCVDENGNPIEAFPGEEQSPPTFGVTNLSTNDFIFEWTLDGAVLEGEIGNTITAVAGGIYQVTATEIATGCSVIAMTTVTLSAPPINWSARLVDGAFSGSNTVEVFNEGIGTYEYSMDGGPFQESNIFTNVEAGPREITIRDINGCGEITFTFGVIDYDRFMTPNGDGFNDTWKIESIADFDLTANIYIFDRYGKLLKQLSPLNTDGWDGTYNGTTLPSSDYWFLIEYTEDDVRKQFRSHFTLKR